MRQGTFVSLLERFGTAAAIHYDGSAVGVPVKAFVQPILEKREGFQALPTPLGTARREKFLYLGPPEVTLEGMERGFITCRGRRYEVLRAQAVYVGERLSHWWALLRPQDEEAEE